MENSLHKDSKKGLNNIYENFKGMSDATKRFDLIIFIEFFVLVFAILKENDTFSAVMFFVIVISLFFKDTIVRDLL